MPRSTAARTFGPTSARGCFACWGPDCLRGGGAKLDSGSGTWELYPLAYWLQPAPLYIRRSKARISIQAIGLVVVLATICCPMAPVCSYSMSANETVNGDGPPRCKIGSRTLPMSALYPKADIRPGRPNVRFAPKAVIRLLLAEPSPMSRTRPSIRYRNIHDRAPALLVCRYRPPPSP